MYSNNNYLVNKYIQNNPFNSTLNVGNKLSNTLPSNPINNVSNLWHNTAVGIAGASSLFNNILSYKNEAINYSLLKQQNNMNRIQNQVLGIQAGEIENQAVQQTNMLRDSFTEAVANAQWQATQRGIKSTSGSVRQNIENSAKEVGEDIKTINTNANRQANNLRTQQIINDNLLQAQAQLQREQHKSNRLSNIIGGIASIGFVAASLL